MRDNNVPNFEKVVKDGTFHFAVSNPYLVIYHQKGILSMKMTLGKGYYEISVQNGGLSNFTRGLSIFDRLSF